MANSFRNSNPVEGRDGQLPSHVTRVQGACRFEEQDMSLLIGHRTMFDTAGNDKQLPLFQPNAVVPELHAESALDNQE